MARRNWCFTLNHPTEEDMQSIPKLLDRKLIYICFGEEKGSKNETYHLQGYAEFAQPVRLAQCKTYIQRAHWEPRRGNQAQAIHYTQKDGKWKEYGTKKQCGYSTDVWEAAYENACQGNFEEIPPKLKVIYYNTLKKVMQDHKTIPRNLDGELENEWHYGPTGTGKSYTVRERYAEFYYKMNNKWWDNYENEDTILIEDVGLSHEWMGDFLKIWADRYAFRAEVKGASTVLRPKRVIVTSNYLPHQIWKDPCIHEPLERRFKFIQYKRTFVHPMFDTILQKNRIQSEYIPDVEPTGDQFCPQGHILDEDGYGIVADCCAKKPTTTIEEILREEGFNQ